MLLKIVIGTVMVLCALCVLGQVAALIWALVNGVWPQVLLSLAFISVLSMATVILHGHLREGI